MTVSLYRGCWLKVSEPDNNEKSRVKSKVPKICMVVLIIVSVVVSVVYCMKIIGREKLLANALAPMDDDSDTGQTDEVSADLYVDGIPYKYKENMINILLLGVDKNSNSDNLKHQADVIMLAAVDEQEKSITLISIPRDTMTDIDIYDVNNNYVGQKKSQIALAYSYGSDEATGCELTKASVSRLLYSIPINGYFAGYMDAVPIVNDAVGGVNVALTQDIKNIGKNGDTVTLYGKTALAYLRYRDKEDAVSARKRENNQTIYLKSFVSALKEKCKANPLFINDLLSTIDKYSTTDISTDSAVYLASQAFTNTSINMITVKGDNNTDNALTEYYVDDAELQKMILQIFYKQITKEE